MKRLILLTVITTALFSNIFAQPGKKLLPEPILGIKAGVNMQQISGDLSEENYSTGYVGGIFAGITKKKIGVQLEALVKSADIEYKPTLAAPTTATIKTVSLDIPVLFEYKLFWHVWVQLGPQFSTYISAKESSKDVKKNFNSANFAGVGGLQVNLPLHLTVAARYIYGLTNVNDESSIKDSWKDRSIQFSLGFRFL